MSRALRPMVVSLVVATLFVPASALAAVTPGESSPSTVTRTEATSATDPVVFADPIGSGWTKVPLKYKLDDPPGKDRHTFINGEHHCWVLKGDPSTYPGRDGGPRCELHFHHYWTKGQAQLAADIKVGSNCNRQSIAQVFGAKGRATAFMMFIRDGGFWYYQDEKIFSPVHDRYVRVNIIHNTSTHKVSLYLNGSHRGTWKDHGSARHYFKAGAYGEPPQRCDVWMKGIQIFKK